MHNSSVKCSRGVHSFWCGPPSSMVQKHILFKQSQWQPNSLLVACKKPSNDACRGNALRPCTRRLPCVHREQGKKIITTFPKSVPPPPSRRLATPEHPNKPRLLSEFLILFPPAVLFHFTCKVNIHYDNHYIFHFLTHSFPYAEIWISISDNWTWWVHARKKRGLFSRWLTTEGADTMKQWFPHVHFSHNSAPSYSN